MLAAAILFSMAMIVLLWRGDPKRRRVIGQHSTGDGATRRRLLCAAALLPAILLAATGDSAAFLIWLGSCVIVGWLVAQIRGRGTG